jgi:hypothetical protein
MHWYQIGGWVFFAAGVLALLFDWPKVVKLVTRTKSGQVLSILRTTWNDFFLIFIGLGLATGAEWPYIVNLTILAAYFLAWAYDFRVRRQRQRAG